MTTTGLKVLALIFMTIDHIAEFNVSMPNWFHWIGRLSAPIFFFCSVIGFAYTNNRKTYLLRLYILSCSMSIINALINITYNYIYLSNNILSTLLVSCIIVAVIDILSVDLEKGVKYIIFFVLAQVLGTALAVFLNMNFNDIYFDIFCAFSVNIFFNEGGILFILLFVLLYYNKNSKRKIAFSYVVFSIIYAVLNSTNTIPYILTDLKSLNFNKLYNVLCFIMQLFQINILPTYGMRWFSIINYYWMIIFALPFILMYNSKKGKGYKYFFYIYYPLHIYFLYFYFFVI